MIAVLFDIDGTLIRSGGAGQAALDQTLKEVFEVTQPQPIQISGRTDRSIIHDLFRAHGIPATAENWNRFQLAYVRHLPQHLRLKSGAVLPGVLELLGKLSRRSDVAVGIITGNAREGARIKLEHFQLTPYFHFGGYGDEHFDRNEVAQLAWSAACDHACQPLSLERAWVIGDTPLDVRCARFIGARAVAVATGFHPKEELALAQPDWLLDDLTDHTWLGDDLSSAL